MATVFKRGGRSNKSGYYYVAWQEHTATGRRRRTKCLKTTDKWKAERIAAKLEGDAALRRDGVIDPALDAIGRQAARGNGRPRAVPTLPNRHCHWSGRMNCAP